MSEGFTKGVLALIFLYDTMSLSYSNTHTHTHKAQLLVCL